jgi:electron transfer flavoprotein alpha subunit
LDENHGIWVFSEIHELALELLAKARQLADSIGTEVALILPDVPSKSNDYFQYGADIIFSITNPMLKEFQVDTYVDALASLANEKKPELILIGATRSGLELAPRLAERLKTGYVTHAIKLEPDADKEFILIDRLSQEGTTVETQVSRIKPQIVTVTKGTFPPIHANSSRNGTIINVSPEIKNSTTKILKIATANSILTNPSVVVCVGRAMKRKEDIAIVNQFAQTIGAGVAYTRSVGDDFKLASSDQCLGFSGRKVNSKLCITCGISGQSQTIAGFANSQIIISINTDPSARIFNFSDYVVVGDLYKILPKLTTAINRLK